MLTKDQINKCISSSNDFNQLKEIYKYIVKERNRPQYHTIVSFIETAINRINNEFTAKELEERKSGGIQKEIEIKLKNIFEEEFPKAGFYHPNDRLGGSDIHSNRYNRGFEVKVCFGSPRYKDGIVISKDGDVRWKNRNVKNKKIEDFLFIKTAIKNNVLVAERIYYGRFSYTAWRLASKNDPDSELRFSETQAKKLCKRLK